MPVIITQDLIRDCLHCLAIAADGVYKDKPDTKADLMESHKTLMEFIYNEHPSRKNYELTPYRKNK